METQIQNERERIKETQEVHEGEILTASEVEQEIRNIFKGGKSY